MYRVREFFWTLFHHRAIIKELQSRLEYTEENAFQIINLMWKEKVRVVISAMQKSFHYVMMVTDGKRHGYTKSESKIPHIFYIQNIITMLKEKK